MSTARVSAEEQYKLIMECRQSGLSDQQWCLDHDIKPGTFYNWVNRLRKKGCCDIPVPSCSSGCSSKETKKQEVVRLVMNEPSASVINDPLPMYETSYPQQASPLPVMELSIGKASFRIANGTDPILLTQMIKTLMEFSC